MGGPEAGAFEEAADRLEKAAGELERALRHLRAAAGHATGRDPARMAAHAFAAHGHVHAAQELIAAQAAAHAARSAPE